MNYDLVAEDSSRKLTCTVAWHQEMVPTTSSDLAEALSQAELLSPRRVLKLTTEILPNLSEDPQELAYALVQRGWLTSYQAEQALAGKAHELVLGGYQLLAPLGAGGMGYVFKAWQKRLNRTVALKMVRPELLEQNPGAVRRFKREALAVAQLSHPNIVSIYDADEDGNTHFIVLEYVDGLDLEHLVSEGGPLPVTQAADYIRQAAMGLQHAHEAGLVHRDIKPSNLLVARENRRGGMSGSGSFQLGLVKILDLGLARMESILESKASLTREGSMMGTPDYCAPEQARDASSVDIRADIYSLGGTFYYLLTGRVPFPEGTVIEKLMKHQQEEPEPLELLRPDVPPEYVAIVRRMMAKSPDDRFQTPLEVARAIEEIAGVPSRVVATQVATATTPLNSDSATGIGHYPSYTPPPWSQSETPPPGAPPANVTVVTADSLQEPERPDEELLHRWIQPAQRISVLRGHKGPVMGLAFSADCKLLATGGLDSSVHVWSLGKSPKDLASLRTSALGDVQTVAFAPNGEYLVTGSASLNARMLRWAWRQSLNRDRSVIEGPGQSDALAFSPDGTSLVSGVGSSIWMWNSGEDPPRKRLVLKNQTGDVKALQFSPDGRQLASGDSCGFVQFWKLGWLGTRAGATLAGHRGAVSCLAFSPDTQLLASAGLDQTVRIWDATGSSVQERSILDGVKGVVRQMLFLPDSQMLLTACDGGQVILWRWSDRTRQHEWKLDQPIICSLALASDGCLLAAGSTDGTATVYDLVPEGA